MRGIQVMLLPLSDIIPAINRKGDTVGAYGQMTVVRQKDGYRLISGGERLMSLIAEGRTLAEALVLPAEPEESWQTLLERLRARRLPYIEEARVMKKLVSDYGFTIKALAMSLGRSQSTVGQKMRLMRYSQDEQDIIEKGAIPEWQAQKMLALPSREARMKNAFQCSRRARTLRRRSARCLKAQCSP
ncbi:MAG: hypothetical protein PHI27_13350 [Eubacteriales bacterium]|nr:hypothetical protein [Eubacteriales bacterium]MDD3883209.1 hypothetical protein [Eubacteriales bacterium]